MRFAGGFEIRPVEDRADLRAFVRAPWAVYADDPNWVPPLLAERRRHLSGANPYFRRAWAQYFVALRDLRPVGRISAHIDPQAQPADGRRVGHFGLVEATDRELLNVLLITAEDWLARQGAGVAEGPYSLSANEEAGLLVDGFDRPPRLLTNYSPAWYGPALEAAGYRGLRDLLAYSLDPARPLSAATRDLAAEAAADPEVTERPLDPGNFTRELRRVAGLVADAWADRPGFVPLSEGELAYATAILRPLIAPSLARVVELRGQPAAALLALPDYYQVLRGLNGRLLPLGWLRFLWRLRVRRPDAARVLFSGMRRDLRQAGERPRLTALLLARLHEAAGGMGLSEVELALTPADDTGALRLLDRAGLTQSKRYRIYRKPLK